MRSNCTVLTCHHSSGSFRNKIASCSMSFILFHLNPCAVAMKMWCVALILSSSKRWVHKQHPRSTRNITIKFTHSTSVALFFSWGIDGVVSEIGRADTLDLDHLLPHLVELNPSSLNSIEFTNFFPGKLVRGITLAWNPFYPNLQLHYLFQDENLVQDSAAVLIGRPVFQESSSHCFAIGEKYHSGSFKVGRERL